VNAGLEERMRGTNHDRSIPDSSHQAYSNYKTSLRKSFLDFGAASIVIASASEAIHGRSNGQRLDCFVAFAPRNDEDGCGLA
jgi:hypothetical protein